MRFATGDEQSDRRKFLLSAKKVSFLKEALMAAGLSVCVFAAASKLNLFERLHGYTRQYENWNLDEIIVVCLFLFFYFTVLSFRKWRQANRANQVLLELNRELEQAAREIKQLRGIIPICARCKNIRDDQGYWQKVEQYLKERTEVKFTHGLCPDCFVILYPDLKLPDDAMTQQGESGQSEGTT